MKLLNQIVRMRCDETLIPRLKRIAEAKGVKYQTLAREVLERGLVNEESKQRTKSLRK